MRAFIAVETGGPDIVGTGASAAPDHLTLRFLGEIPETWVGRLTAALAPVAATTPGFDFDLEGVGGFPSARDPRVVWVGVTRGREPLELLARRVAEAVTPIAGGPDRAEFVPHLTLFRVRGPADRDRARQLLEGSVPPPRPRTVAVREFLLKESRLERRGAQHRVVARFPLTGGPAATRPPGPTPP